MVSIAKENAFELREFLACKMVQDISANPIKTAFSIFLGIHKKSTQFPFDASSLPLFQRCAISGLNIESVIVNDHEIGRLLGQASKIDSTPQPWVADILGVMAFKWLIDRRSEESMSDSFQDWLNGFLPGQMSAGRLSVYEQDLAHYILEGDTVSFQSCTIPLFLNYVKKIPILEHSRRQKLIAGFMNEYREQVNSDSSSIMSGIFIHVFDTINSEVALVPPNGWSLNDLLCFLENIPTGLRRWTWEEKARTKTSDAVKWFVQNEYHVQNLLYCLLAPIFTDISDEVYIEQLGQKTPRLDLYLPSIHTVIEVKFKKDNKKSFQSFIGEVAEDASLYRSDSKYNNANLLCFLWDNTRATQEFTKFKEGVLKIDGIDACITVSAPSQMIF